MTDRERFIATMHYRPRDRAPICDFGFWPETLDEWKKQGLPDWVKRGWGDESTDKFFGMDRWQGGPAAGVALCPDFGWTKLEDRGDHEVIRDNEGVTVLRKKEMGSIPMHLGHTLVDRASWQKEFKWRLDPGNPDRYPKDWAAARKIWNDPACPYPRTAWGGSLYGWIRNWMGVENLSYLVYDDPAFFEEMVTTVADCIVGTLTKLFENGARFDACSMWEDMCYNAGPLLSPPLFKQYLVPHYKRITGLLRQHGCDVIYLDCDGKIDELLPMWLDAGVNCMFPIEIGTWGADPVKYRRQYGKDLLIIGGVDKHVLARSKVDIEKEVHRLAPLVEEGGYIPTPDHRVPPDVPLDNYLHYLKLARQVWGKGVNLKPMINT
jgi:hypothetical protein